MSEKNISYLNRTFEDYNEALRNNIATFYPEIANDFDDASIGSWLIDLVASVADNLSYHIDATYTETNIDTASQRSSVYALARSNGLKVPGPKGSMVELLFTCNLPVSVVGDPNSGSEYGMPNWNVAPIIKKGTRLKSNSGQYFELTNNVYFNEQFDENGYSDRTITPFIKNGQTKYYVVTKTATAVAGESNIYSVHLNETMIKPFMDITLPYSNIMGIESIILVNGNINSEPSITDFMRQCEHFSGNTSNGGFIDMYRFFEVDSLTEQYRWGDDVIPKGEEKAGRTVTYTYGYYDEESETTVPVTTVTKGQWIPLTQKFITEYTDSGYLRVIFGSGAQVGQDIHEDNTDITKYLMSQMIQNNALGRLPKAGMTMYILYRVGGGAASNVPKDTITTISYLDYEFCGDDAETAANVKNTLRVTNPTPSVSGKDSPSVDEIKMMIKNNNAAQGRCVTVKDYEDRVLKMPPRYGCPFRLRASEENNKIMLYLLGIDNNRFLTGILPSQMIVNIQNYLSMYRQINDYVEIKSGRIVNISIEVDLYIDKNYNSSDVVRRVIDAISDYMDINKHMIGEDIYISDIERIVSELDGVLNIIDFRVYNNFGEDYSVTKTSQEIKHNDALEESDRVEIDLEASDYILNSEVDEMFEIKYPENDIKIRVKTR